MFALRLQMHMFYSLISQLPTFMPNQSLSLVPSRTFVKRNAYFRVLTHPANPVSGTSCLIDARLPYDCFLKSILTLALPLASLIANWKAFASVQISVQFSLVPVSPWSTRLSPVRIALPVDLVDLPALM